MVKLKKAQENIVSVIAHAVVASSIANNVKGMEGFEAFHLNRLSARDRALVDFFRAEIKRIPADMAGMMEKGRNGPPP